MQRVSVTTGRKRQVVDVTAHVEKVVHGAAGLSGIAHVNVLHTTAAITLADLDPGTDLDYLDAFEAMIPDLPYRHPHNPAHVGDHISAAMIGAAAAVPFANGRLLLGTWQRVVLMEFDGPRERKLVIALTAEIG